MKLIVGLGNPGAEYARTRHNVGFMVVDELANRQSLTWEQRKAVHPQALFAQDGGVLYLKPQTFMNNSGQAVGAALRYYKIASDDMLVVYDEADLAFGLLRVRRGGGSAGHNGIKSLIAHIDDHFCRFRIGVRNEHFEATPTDAFVLQRFTATEEAALPQIITKTAGVLTASLTTEQPLDTTHRLID